jgi:hypothetical protein
MTDTEVELAKPALPEADVNKAPLTTETPEQIAQENLWETLKEFDNYEINKLSQQIREKETKIVVTQDSRKDKYVWVMLNEQFKYFHDIVATQFVENPDPLYYSIVDHKDGDRSNNSPDNLRWVSHALNNRNKRYYKSIVYEYVNSLPENAAKITNYGDFELGYDYYYTFKNNPDGTPDPETVEFYVFNELNYRKLHKHDNKYVNVRTSGNRYIRIYCDSIFH